MWRWTRLTSVKWEDSWAERLQFLGSRVVFITWPDAKTVRIEAFVDEETGSLLVREFGGKLTKAQVWSGNPGEPRPPLSIRRRLRVYADQESFDKAAGESRKAMLIPAGMAFGTGEHATTSSCLRMLCDCVDGIQGPWTALDAGTGSGILAIAAAVLGAREVEAFDFDPACVRIAKANARANRVRNVRVARADVLAWKPAAARDVVMANLFSDLLIRVVPALKKATRRGGVLIFSGVLKDQLGEVAEVLERGGFRVERTVVRGKWSAGRCQRG